MLRDRLLLVRNRAFLPTRNPLACVILALPSRHVPSSAVVLTWSPQHALRSAPQLTAFRVLPLSSVRLLPCPHLIAPASPIQPTFRRSSSTPLCHLLVPTRCWIRPMLLWPAACPPSLWPRLRRRWTRSRVEGEADEKEA